MIASSFFRVLLFLKSVHVEEGRRIAHLILK
jgi:hypothetical protein